MTGKPIRIADVPVGALTVSREMLDGQLRLTYRRRHKGAHPEQPRFVATTLVRVVQYRGPESDRRNVKFQYRGATRCWTDGLFPVEVVARRCDVQESA